MLRFKYDNKEAIVYENGKIDFIDADSRSIQREKLLENCKKHEYNSYKEVLNVIKLETFSKTEKYYYVFLSDGYLMIAIKEMNFDPEIRIFYKIENKGIEDAIKRYFAMTDDSGRVIIGNHQNNFNFITAMPILMSLFVAAALKFRKEKIYKKFKKKKKVLKGKKPKFRDVSAPHAEIKEPLRELNKILQKIYDKKNIDFQVAYKRGKNTLDNAKPHTENQFMFKVDIEDFFPSCKREFVKKYLSIFFKNAPNREIVETDFLDLILDKKTDALFIGNPISGTLANTVINKPVLYIKNIIDTFNMEFTVYADDMTFSSERFISKKFVSNIFTIAFSKYNMRDFFKLNDGKSHGLSGERRRVTGVAINGLNQMTIPRKYYRMLRVKIHKLSIGETNINIKKLQGQFAHATMIDFSGKILRLVKNFESTNAMYNLVSIRKLAELETRDLMRIALIDAKENTEN